MTKVDNSAPERFLSPRAPTRTLSIAALPHSRDGSSYYRIWLPFHHLKRESFHRFFVYPDDMGDAYCFTALERASKFIITWHLGKRCPADTYAFAQKLRDATNGRFQLTTDGFRPYLTAILGTLGGRVDFATLVKVYGESEDERRYSPPRVLQVVPTIRAGAPDPARICTSHVERSNLSVRMSIRRMTRLTNAFSKKWSNHEAALALFFGYYNFVRVHMTLRTTPAVAIGLTDRPWTVAELLRRVVI